MTTRQIAAYDNEADACASVLLMPEEFILRLIRRCYRPEQLATIFQVSPEAMRRRLDRLAEEFV